MDFVNSALSPLDGRYKGKTFDLRPFLSGDAYTIYRYRAEVQYLAQLLKKTQDLTDEKINEIKTKLLEGVSMARVLEMVSKYERETRHDVKAIEYTLKEILENKGFGEFKELVHFALTSQDANSAGQTMGLRDAMNEVMIPAMKQMINDLHTQAKRHRSTAMVAYTHGQVAVPTTLGYQLLRFVYRMKRELKHIVTATENLTCKFGGAVGHMNAHRVAYPSRDWPAELTTFVEEGLGLKRSVLATQVDDYDSYAVLFDALARFSVICLNFATDMWLYIHNSYLKLKVVSTETGSSTMPQKVNPIHFENAEGNLRLAVSLLKCLGENLPQSRLQRDLSDSTMCRSIGTPLGYLLIAVTSLTEGIGRVDANESKIAEDLESNYQMVAEGYQTVLRRIGYDKPYEKLKEFSRGKGEMGKGEYLAFVDTLDIEEKYKEELRSITPQTYIGYAADVDYDLSVLDN